MNQRFSIYLFAILLFLPAFTIAQSKEIKFNLINGMNGIFLGKINSITQDKNGAMWFSDQTNRCITQYDGSRMTRYQHDPKNPNSLGGLYPECISVDSSGIIWIGLWGFGLDKFDPETKTFTHYRYDPNDPTSISSDTVSNILIDHQKNIWIGTMAGLNQFDPATGTFKRFDHDPADPKSLSYHKVRALYEDHQGTLWVGTGFAWDNDKLGGLNRFDRKTGTFTRYLHDPKNKNSLINNKIRAIFEDSKGTLWIGSMDDGLHSMDHTSGIITRHKYDAQHPEEISRPPLKSQFDHITFITEDAEECLWIGTLSNGLVRYNPHTRVSTHYLSPNSAGTGFKDESGWTAYASTGGWLWVSTQEANLYKVDLSINKVDYNTSIGPIVYTIIDEKSAVQWYATPNGLLRRELSTNKLTRFQNEPGNPKSVSSNWVNRIYQDLEGTIWLSTPAGLNRFDEKTQSFTRYATNESDSTSLAWNDISILYTDSKSNFWVCTYGGGLHLMDKAKGTFIRFQSKESDSTSLSGNILTSIAEGDTNDLWIGTWDAKGVNKMDYKSKKCKHYLKGVSINEILNDSKGDLWVIGINNLYKYDNRKDTFLLYTIGDVPVSFSEVKSAVIDKEDNLWVTTVTEISRINLRNDQYVAYGKLNGFTAQDYAYGSTSLLKNGEIIIGHFEGYYAFHPNKLEVPKGRQELFFGDFFINGKLVAPGTKSALSTQLNETEEIRLSYDQNVFSVTFYAADYSPEESQRFYYKLENYDKDWKLTDPNQQIYYFNIPPGKYKLRLNSTNTRYGTWIEKSFTIVINPPWWKTWWAYGCYALILMSLGYAIHRLLRAQVIKAERERNRAHELAQAREIEKAYHQLKNTQAQLIQSEKMASLGELTAGIAHEIQNPLNFINNFADVNAELIDELNQGIEKGDMAEVKSISVNIKENEQKIIFHGKRADAIVKGMLQHSRSSSGVKEPTDINALADEYLRLAYHGLRAKDKSFNATMKTDFDSSIGMVNVIPQDIGRVILNLITNAFYAVSEKQKRHSITPYPLKEGDDYVPTVSISTKNLSLTHPHSNSLRIGGRGSHEATGFIEISVSDNGNGIPKEVMEKIFQPFFTTKPSGQGTGLGLSLSYDIIKSHGGELKVETKEGEGAEFIIQLPVA